MKKISVLFVNLFLCLSFASQCVADQITFDATVNRRTVSLGQSIQLSLNFDGMQDIGAPQLPQLDGFQWSYRGPSSSIAIVNGKISRSVTHIYSLLPLRSGRLVIPSLTIDYKGKTYASREIAIDVLATDTNQSLADRHSGSSVGLDDRIFLTLQLDKTQVYVNELINVIIKLYMNRVQVRDVQLQKFDPEGFSVSEFKQQGLYRRNLNGILYDISEANAEMFALRPGEFKIGPVKLRCNLLVERQSNRSRDDFFGSDIFGDFFGRYDKQPLELASTDQIITVKELPEEGKPDSFKGALGRYDFSLEAGPKEIKEGDPITVKMIITGVGNFKTVNAPVFEREDWFKIYDPQVTFKDNQKIFEQIIIPKHANVVEIPEFTFSYFDPDKGSYQTIKKGPIPIKVKPGSLGEGLKVFDAPGTDSGLRLRTEILGRDIIYIKSSPGTFRRKGDYLFKSRIFISLILFSLVAVLFVFFSQKRRERLKSDVRYARRLRAAGRAKKHLVKMNKLLALQDNSKFFAEASKALREYLGDRFHLSAAGITADIVEHLKQFDLDELVIDQIKQYFETCDQARYAPSSMVEGDAQRVYNLLEQIITSLERLKK